MRRLSDRFLQLGALFALVGMGLGVWMGATENFALAPVHAHINLLGWVSMLLYGLFYRAFPQAAEGRLPVVHFWLAVLSLAAMAPVLALYLMGNQAMSAPLGAASVAMLGAMALFTVIVFKATRKGQPAAT